MNQIGAFIQGLPKAELHIHIEGSFEPELLFAIAARNGIAIPYESVDELRQAYAFSELQDFLDIYYQGMTVLREEADFYDLTRAYLARAKDDNVRHVEMFFDPQAHTARGVPFATVVAGITRAMDEAAANDDLSSGLILCILRHLDEEDGLATLEQALAFKDRIIGIGLDSSERGHPPGKFARLFEKARTEGFRLVAHAGEEGPASYVREALDLLRIERIDHGNRAMEDPALVERIVAEGLALTVCPLSNLRLGGVPSLDRHPLREMARRGLRVTVNSDDPAYFGGYVNDNFVVVAEALSLTEEDLTAFARTSLEAAFIGEPRRRRLLEELDSYVADWQPKAAGVSQP
jgi:adenosine deaminase